MTDKTRKPGAAKRLLIIPAGLIFLLLLFTAVRAVGIYMNGRTPPGGINEELYVELNGSRQWISIYGEDADNPVLLYLHGGPGSATSMYDYAFTRRWADVYTVVTWDQRGCGKSEGGAEELSCAQLLEDALELSRFLLERLDAEKLTLLGHSWGSYLGCRMALERPEYYDCLIGTGQLVDMRLNEELLAAEAAKWAVGDPEGQALLFKLNPQQPDMEHYAARNALMERYGYGLFDCGRDYSLVSAVVFNPYYSLGDWLEYLRGGDEYVGLLLSEEFASLSLLDETGYEMPFYSINGERDYQTNIDLAREYFERVEAPEKAFYVMEDMTHGLLESRSEEFSGILHEIAAGRRL